jgi:hypothetical protein
MSPRSAAVISSAVRGSSAVGSRTSTREAAAREASSAVETGSSTSGSHARWACLAASRAIVRQRATPLTAFAASHLEMLRAACQGTIASTPSSVADCTANSSRSPFARACTSTTRGCGGSTSRRVPTRTTTSFGDTASHSPSNQTPRPSPTVTCSPTRRRRTAAAWCASAPVRTTASPTSEEPAASCTKCSGISRSGTGRGAWRRRPGGSGRAGARAP